MSAAGRAGAVGACGLPRAVVPFVVTAPYRVGPDLVRLGRLPAHVDDPGPPTLLRLDDRAPGALAHLLGELDEEPGAIRWVDPDVPAGRWRSLAQAVGAAWARDGDPRVAVDDDALVLPWLGVRVRADGALETQPPDPRTPPALAAHAPAAVAALTRLPSASRGLDALRLAVAEDLVVITRRHPGDGGRAAYLHVAAPSGWDPGARGGATFVELHRPVPDADALHAAAGALVDAMVTRGPFLRYVWSLAADEALSHHPRRHPVGPLAGVAPADLWYRAERQTTLPLPELDASLFMIRVLHAPLASVLTTDARREALAAAVASMGPALRAYKGLGGSGSG